MKGFACMSINDLQNINNFRLTHQYIKVQTSNTDKQMSQEQSLFSFNSGDFKQSEGEFLLFPGSNEYDDEQTVKNKADWNLFL